MKSSTPNPLCFPNEPHAHELDLSRPILQRCLPMPEVIKHHMMYSLIAPLEGIHLLEGKLMGFLVTSLYIVDARSICRYLDLPSDVKISEPRRIGETLREALL